MPRMVGLNLEPPSSGLRFQINHETHYTMEVAAKLPYYFIIIVSF